MRSRLRRVKRCAAPASPHHVAPVACAPDGTDRPAWVAVIVTVGAAGWWHHDPSAISGYEVANKVVRELVARFGHGDVLPRTTDKQANSAVHSGPGERVEMAVCLGPSSGGADG